MKLKIKPRIELIIKLNSIRRAHFLKRYGSLKYVSRAMHYVILYIDGQKSHQTENQLRHLRFVNQVHESPLVNLSKQLTAETVEAVKPDDKE